MFTQMKDFSSGWIFQEIKQKCINRPLDDSQSKRILPIMKNSTDSIIITSSPLSNHNFFQIQYITLSIVINLFLEGTNFSNGIQPDVI